jgi:hypothetical protein
MFAEVGINGGGGANAGNFNTTVLQSIKTNFPKAFAFVAWCQTWAMYLQQGLPALMSDPAVVTLSGVPPGV